MCKAYTQWNEESGKYKRLCENASCKAELARRAKENMRKRYGKDHLLNDPEMQRKMLSGRSISGSYKFRDGKTVIGYNSSYEQDFLEFIDTDLELNPSMISQCPISLHIEMKKILKNKIISTSQIIGLKMESHC